MIAHLHLVYFQPLRHVFVVEFHLLGISAYVVEGVDCLLVIVVEVEFLQAEELAQKTYPVVEVPNGEFAADIPL